jgi:hypothetical protein
MTSSYSPPSSSAPYPGWANGYPIYAYQHLHHVHPHVSHQPVVDASSQQWPGWTTPTTTTTTTTSSSSSTIRDSSSHNPLFYTLHHVRAPVVSHSPPVVGTASWPGWTSNPSSIHHPYYRQLNPLVAPYTGTSLSHQPVGMHFGYYFGY